MSNDETKLVAIGRVVKAHGLRGELNVKPISNIENRFEILEKVVIEFADGKTKDYIVEYAKIGGQFIRLKLDGVNDRDAADMFRGVYVLIQMNDLPPLDDDTYYVFDLEGLSVFDSKDKLIGTVIRIESYPANDILVIAGENGEIMIPAVKDYILDVNLDAKKITVDLHEGLPFTSGSGFVR